MNRGPFIKRQNNMFTNAMEDLFANDFLGNILSGQTFKIDVRETKTEYIVDADVPGVKKSDIDISFSDGELSIVVNKVEKIENLEDDQSNYVIRERKCSSMTRNVYLPNAMPESVKAKLEDGVLTITVVKEEKNAHKVDID